MTQSTYSQAFIFKINWRRRFSQV